MRLASHWGRTGTGTGFWAPPAGTGLRTAQRGESLDPGPVREPARPHAGGRRAGGGPTARRAGGPPSREGRGRDAVAQGINNAYLGRFYKVCYRAHHVHTITLGMRTVLRA